MHTLQRTGMKTAAALAVIAATSAQAADDPNPYFIGGRQVFTHDSNILRSNNAQSASYSTTTLFGGFDQQISRQRVYANADVSLNRYSGDFKDQLNNTSYGVSAGWDWATIEKLSGSLTANVNRTLATLGDNTTSNQSVGDRVTTQQYALTARWGGQSILTLEGGASYNKVSYTQQTTSDSTGDSASLGLYYRAGPSLRVGTAVRYSHSDTPQSLSGANKENGRYIDLLATWLPTSTTSVYSRVSWAHQTNSRADSRDFNGLTGSVSASYAPTPKLSFQAGFSRDAGVNGTFFTLNTNTPPVQGTPAPTPVRGLSESSQVTNSFSLGATYAATAKISVTAGAQLRYAKLVDDVPVAGGGGAVTTVNRDDNSKLYSLGVTYAIARAWELGCSVSHSTRELDASVIAVGLSYTANVASCRAQFTLR